LSQFRSYAVSGAGAAAIVMKSGGSEHAAHYTLQVSMSLPVHSSRVSWEPQRQASGFISAFIAVARAIESMGPIALRR